ncbi:unnamed protein product [Didymodactylos carnosus]|uniref:Uncharacterized protein n=1 Tax=Didymodactylos carnosus TaxID=1234261 RepID=A0A815EIN7_9BILA|nr:unnamed protein product [Didymodactylos carnosus]CAF1312426.1 unnamed protein product [Didymodactylos carnosus]CAF3911291.1 unnamed protein product [Didymodactylos carnosus]CAF4151231.1 unnamed protein product [Didymodactylos carnosus]
MEEVEFTWKRTRKKKSTDSESICACLLKQLPVEYLSSVTYGFNKIPQLDVLKLSKHGKVTCLSKDGMDPSDSESSSGDDGSHADDTSRQSAIPPQLKPSQIK